MGIVRALRERVTCVAGILALDALARRPNRTDRRGVRGGGVARARRTALEVEISRRRAVPLQPRPQKTSLGLASMPCRGAEASAPSARFRALRVDQSFWSHLELPGESRQVNRGSDVPLGSAKWLVRRGGTMIGRLLRQDRKRVV